MKVDHSALPTRTMRIVRLPEWRVSISKPRWRNKGATRLTADPMDIGDPGQYFLIRAASGAITPTSCRSAVAVPSQTPSRSSTSFSSHTATGSESNAVSAMSALLPSYTVRNFPGSKTEPRRSCFNHLGKVCHPRLVSELHVVDVSQHA